MADKTAIEWTDATWNPVTGCEEVSPGCDHCYAKTFAERWRGTPGHPYENGFDLTLRPERLTQPLRWTRPRRIFVNSMSDLFHDDIPDEYIARVFAVMASTPQHTYQILTKRHGRMRSLLRDECRCHAAGTHFRSAIEWAATPHNPDYVPGLKPGLFHRMAWPLPNVWLGVSVENQQWADIRIPALLQTPAAVRWLSCEPLLGPLDLAAFVTPRLDSVDWVVIGGESGHGARPMHPDWAGSLRDQCSAAGVPYLFKQWGAWVPESAWLHRDSAPAAFLDAQGEFRLLVNGKPVEPPMARGAAITIRQVSKKTAGRVLDGRTWDEYPEVPNA